MKSIREVGRDFDIIRDVDKTEREDAAMGYNI
jgi:hypothetical protein